MVRRGVEGSGRLMIMVRDTCGNCARKTGYYCDVTTWAVDDDDECSVPPEFGGMSWKPMTCETCALSVPKYGIPEELVCRAGACSVAPSTKCMIYECGATKLCYRERTDSVERVAREMLVELACISAFTPDSAKEGVAAMHYRTFRNRLLELEVNE